MQAKVSKARSAAAAGNALAEAKAALGRWRAGCRGPGRTPDALRRLAVKAAAVGGLEATARELGLTPDRLRSWMQELGTGEAPPASIEFFELPVSPPAAAAECRLRIEEHGRVIEITLQGQALAQLPSLLATLRAGGAAR